jgi:hypothetical protein
MRKRNSIIVAGLLIVSAISIDVLEGLGYELLSQHYANFVPAALFGAGFSLLFLSLFNKQKKIE